MSEFQQYKRKEVAELRPVTQKEIEQRVIDGVSISQEDARAGSPEPGDMIARNPKNHKDQWLVAKQYFEDNFAPILTGKEK